MASAFGLPSLYDPSISQDELELQRRQAMVDMLRQQSQINPNRQVGGVAYKVSPMEMVAKILSGGLGAKMDRDTADKKLALEEKRNRAMMDSIDALTGAGASGGDNVSRARAALLMGNKELANRLLANAWEETPEMKNMRFKGQKPNEVGRLEMDQKRKEALMTLAPGQTVYNPSGGNVQFQTPETMPPEVRQLTETLRGAGIDPASPDGRRLFSALALKQATHQPAPQVTVTTEKGYAGAMAGKLADMDALIIDAARGAPDRIMNARRIKEVLDQNPITGTAANVRLGIEKAFATAGVIDGKNVKNTEDLASLLAMGTLEAIKTSGLGTSQGFTDKDRIFLEKAKSGTIEINPGTLRMLANLNEKAAQASLDKGNRIIQKLKKNPNMGGVGMDLDEVQTLPNVRVVDW